jgi:hypothetical protein
MYFLVDLLTAGFDDDDDKRTKEDESLFYGQRLVGQLIGKGYDIKKGSGDINYPQQLLRYVLGGAANEQLGHGNPMKVYYDYADTPSTFKMQIDNTINALTGTLALPLEIYNAGAPTAVNEWAYQTSKVVPYGSNYRLISSAIEQLLKDYSNINKE